MSVAEQDQTVQVHDAMWPQRVRIVSDKLHVLWPDNLHGRIECGTALALDPGKVKVSGGRWRVADENGQWQTVNGACTCPDYKEAPQGFCKHRAAAKIVRDAQAIPDEDLIMREPGEDEEEEDEPDDPGAHQDVGAVAGEDARQPAATQADMVTPPATGCGPSAGPEEETGYSLPPRFFTVVQGVKCVKYTGLLRLAHQYGLQSVEAEWTLNEEKLSLARAQALFQDGRRFVESGDSTPESGKRVGLHWRRLALTRAKARCLRDALGIDDVSEEEMH